MTNQMITDVARDERRMTAATAPSLCAIQRELQGSSVFAADLPVVDVRASELGAMGAAAGASRTRVPATAPKHATRLSIFATGVHRSAFWSHPV